MNVATHRVPHPTPAVSTTKINDLVLKIATANGSGSQSANLILMRAIFHMGIPVSSKNLFPSNIQGLPTWFTIRANEDGWIGQKTNVDVLIAMNAETAAQDLADLHPGAIVIINEALKRFVVRTDLTVFTVPFSKLVEQVCEDTRLRKMVANIIYVGVAAFLLYIEMDEVRNAITTQFARKPKAAKLNGDAAALGYSWAKEHLEEQSVCRLRRTNKTKGNIIIEGNEATALGALFGGVTFVSWYPITPSSSFAETLSYYLEKYRRDPDTGKATYAVVQAEDELAAIAMVVGAGWAGARAITGTSGPGVSLMAELAGFSYFAEVPAVIVDVQRMGPSTGLPTRTSQGDIAKAYQLSHGDCKHILLIPGNIRECFEFAGEALELAESFQTLVLLMTDLDLAMNKWLSEPFDFPNKLLARGKVLTAEDLGQDGSFARYRDVDGDGIPYRTLPATNHPNAGYFTRGTGHTESAGYTEDPVQWHNNLDRLAKKFDTARDRVPRPVIELVPRTKTGIIAYGSSDLAVREARRLLETRHELASSYLRLRALPVNHEVHDFIAGHPVVYVVEQNRDAQMASILRSEYPELAPRIRSVLHYNGLPIDAETIVSQIVDRQTSKEIKP
ncbi:MAG: 2-oxoacid:acceptor oxidoreductase subunit alpha [Candidatus Hydrogenedentes bacterium]|nr:2-oxoacid:acceptor oxidoreductase subunit alpha [Candidatus Hydrogenedentota bacterium]